MAQANLPILKNRGDQESPRTPIEVEPYASDEWINPGPAPAPKVRRLDVDAVLARSLPKALGDTAPGTKAVRNQDRP